jgi:hypothetical protein
MARRRKEPEKPPDPPKVEGVKKVAYVLDWLDLPEPIKEQVADWHAFANDVYLKMGGEFKPRDLAKGMVVIEAYYKDQCRSNGFKGTLEDFIKDYGLEFEVWVIHQGFPLDDVDILLVSVCW